MEARGQNGVLIRDALERDGADLAILADAATRRLMSWLWEEHAADGQPNSEVGRTVILSDQTSPSHLSNWIVADVDGGVAGALNSYRLPVTSSTTSDRSAAVQRPLIELKALAEGTWYVGVASVHPEFRGRGVAKDLISTAERTASDAGADALTLRT